MSMSVQNKQILHGGFKSLRQFFQKEKSRFSAAPILIIEGGGSISTHVVSQGQGAGGGSSDMQTMAGRQIHFLLAQKMGLRTVVSKGGGIGGGKSSVFYTEQILQEQIELASRIGATTVCAVGNRTAMDLAKALATKSTSSADTTSSSRQRSAVMEELILVPNTYDAVLACAHPYSLYLHAQEDVMLVQPMTNNEVVMPSTTIATLEANLFQQQQQDMPLMMMIQSMQTSIRVCLALAMDADADDSQKNQDELRALLDNIITTSIAIGDSEKTTTAADADADDYNSKMNELHTATMNHLLQVGGKTLQFGFGHAAPRSLPLAVAASLMPTVFPEQDFLTLMASCCLPLSSRSTSTQSPLASSSSPLLLTTESVGTLLSHVRENQMHWNCLDAPTKKIRTMLEQYTLLPTTNQ